MTANVAIPCAFIAALYASVGWIIFTQCNERRLAGLYTLEYRMQEDLRMRGSATNQGGNLPWWEDG